ncbi:uncharacterized protein LOC133304362 isoform X3 [Gastrolobium bilobum]|uniref:uncharacterized protein LOC133304362 isoform X3 n=1 Tax=Gastrolobium bilobum TaxID=150636 RepID=UPI002AAFBA05|nr:uncharacterized protein LOC133304362 isoform X3 [Gastrolobium bilobum]
MSSTRSGPTVGSCRVAGDNRATFQPLPNPTTNLQGDEIKPLSGKPYYHVVLSKTHLSTRYVMVINIYTLLSHNDVSKCGCSKGAIKQLILKTSFSCGPCCSQLSGQELGHDV